MLSPEIEYTNLSVHEQFATCANVEVLPDSVTIDGAPEGLAVTNTSYILHRRNERYSETPSFEAAQFISTSPKVCDMLGFHLTQDEQSYFFQAPRVDALNETKASLPSKLGLNTGKFVELDESLIPAEKIVALIAKREIPISHRKSTNFTEHDITKHMLGYALMHEDLFSSFVLLAQKAEAGQDKTAVFEASDLFDVISSWITTGRAAESKGYLSILEVAMGVPPIRAAIRIKRLIRKQEALFNDLQQHAKY